MLSDARYKPPFVRLPDGSKPITNKAGHFIILNPFAQTKLRYWTLYATPDGQYRARFNNKHDEPVGRFGSYTVIHLRPHDADREFEPSEEVVAIMEPGAG